MPARKAKASQAPSHLQDFIHELISKHGPRTVGMILHGFTNMGYALKGDTVDDQYETISAAIADDPRLFVSGDNPGRGGDWIDIKKDNDGACG